MMLRFLVLVCQLLALLHAEEQTALEYLYGVESPPVKEYTGEANLFLESKKQRVVEFYSPSCPACVEFKSHYVDLATNTIAKYPGVDFYSVSCDHHHSVCQEFGVLGFPSLFVFQEGDDQKGELVEIDEEREAYTPELLGQKLNIQEPPAAAVSVKRRRMDDGPDFDADEDADGGSDEDVDKDTEGSNPGDVDAGSGEDIDTQSDENSDNGGGDDGDSPDRAAPSEDTNKDALDSADNSDEDTADDKEESGDEDSKEDAPSSADKSDEGVADGEDGSDDGDSKDGAPDSADQSNEDVTDDKDKSGSGSEDEQGKPDEPQSEEDSDEDAGLPGGSHRMRRVGAGAARARDREKDMDRYREEMREKFKLLQAARARKRLGDMGGKQGTTLNKLQSVDRDSSEAMTTTMKALRPGTKEYDERRKALLERVEKARQKMKARERKFREGDATQILKKENLPFKKDVKRPTFKEKVPIMKRFAKMTEEEETILDATLALVISLKTSTFLKQELDHVGKKALRDFLDLLSIALPPEWGIHNMVDTLRREFPFITRSEKNLISAMGQFPLPRYSFSQSCSADKGKMSGYSCGFWKLMHVITVGVAEQRGGLNLIESQMVGPNTRTFAPIEAADVLRNYIANFFTCTTCRNNFIEHYDDCDNNRRCDRLSESEEDSSPADWKELALWLWEVHNEVSVRIVRERASRNRLTASMGGRTAMSEEISVIFPNIETCFKCFHEDGTWNEAEVFKYLEKHYWGETDPNTDRLLKFEGESSRSFSFLWIMVIAIVYFVYSAISKHSDMIQTSVIRGRHMVAMGAAGMGHTTVGGKKE